MIGFSLSGCVQDIIKGKVKLEDVEKIVANTAWTDENVQEQLKSYLTDYWKHNPKLAEFVFWELWYSGRIEQPRLLGQKPPMWDKQERNWV